MKTIRTLEELSVGQLIAIRRQLRQRFGIGQRGNIIEVAFGMAEARGRIDRRRPNAICFYVRHKRQPRAVVDRIPPQLTLTLKEGPKGVEVCLPTDVILLGRRQVRPTGQPLRHQQSGNLWVTAGCVLAWKIGRQRKLNWGVLTVGHGFSRVGSVPEPTARVRIGTPAEGLVEGTLLARSRPFNRQQVDAALVEVARSGLVRAGWIPEGVATTGKKVRPLSLLKNDRGSWGFTFPQRTMIPLRIARFLPISEMVPALGSLKNVLEAISQAGAFGMGSSGSVWALKSAGSASSQGIDRKFTRTSDPPGPVSAISQSKSRAKSQTPTPGKSPAKSPAKSTAKSQSGTDSSAIAQVRAKPKDKSIVKLSVQAGSGSSASRQSGPLGELAGMQQGGLPDDFSRGWGQALETVLDWCVSELATLHRRPVSEIDLRLIRVI